jgi:hypothetical protein
VLTEILVVASLVLNIIAFSFIFYIFRQQYLALKDNADAFRMLIEFINKSFIKTLEDHESIIKIIGDNDEKVVQSLTENDQKIVNLVSETQKNIVNLAMFLGYRPRNLDDL